MSAPSHLHNRLVEHLGRRDLFHIEEFARQAGTIIRASCGDIGWEYGPDFEDPTYVTLAIAIDGSLKNKERLERLHSLPLEGEGFKIVAGLLPRDAEQFALWDGAEISARDWKYGFELHADEVKVFISAPSDVPEDVILSMVLAEIGEVNYARHVRDVVHCDDGVKPFSTFAAHFAELFPACAYAALLAKKRDGIVQDRTTGAG